MRFWVGFFTTIAGVLIILFSRKIFDNFGRIPWAEDKFGAAGTLTLIRLIGLALFLFGVMLWTGLFDLIFGGIFRTIFRGLGEEVEEGNGSSLILKALAGLYDSIPE